MILIILFIKWENNITEEHTNCEATRLIYVWNIQTAWLFAAFNDTNCTVRYMASNGKMTVATENGMKRSEYSLFKIQTIPKINYAANVNFRNKSDLAFSKINYAGSKSTYLTLRNVQILMEITFYVCGNK